MNPPVVGHGPPVVGHGPPVVGHGPPVFGLTAWTPRRTGCLFI